MKDFNKSNNYKEDMDENINNVKEKVDDILDNQRSEFSFIGLFFLIAVTLVTNIWAQHLYNNYVTNYGMGQFGINDNLVVLFSIAVLAIVTILMFRDSNNNNFNI